MQMPLANEMIGIIQTNEHKDREKIDVDLENSALKPQKEQGVVRMQIDSIDPQSHTDEIVMEFTTSTENSENVEKIEKPLASADKSCETSMNSFSELKVIKSICIHPSIHPIQILTELKSPVIRFGSNFVCVPKNDCNFEIWYRFCNSDVHRKSTGHFNSASI